MNYKKTFVALVFATGLVALSGAYLLSDKVPEKVSSTVSQLNKKELSLQYEIRFAKGNDSAPPLLLLMHGYGGNEAGLFTLQQYLPKNWMVISARAPVELAKGRFAWYHLQWQNNRVVDYDSAGAEQAIRTLSGFLSEVKEAYKPDHDRIYLMGFSQGAMMSIDMALTEPSSISAIMAMSGRLRRISSTEGLPVDQMKHLGAFVAHGVQDEIILIEEARKVRALFDQLPIETEYREYQMGHAVSQQAQRDAFDWLATRQKKSP